MVLFLIGMPGVGKSKTGKEVASQLGYQYFDTDKYIEEKLNKSIPDIFNEDGEIYFRVQEKEALDELSKKHNAIISCGGGIIKDPQNRSFMKRGYTIFLDAPLEVIQAHLDQSDVVRPLLKVKTLEELYQERIESYLCFMDYWVPYTDYKDAANRIVKFVKKPWKKEILVINGPNLNLLGKRDPKHYGSLTLNMINDQISFEHSFEYTFYQSNHEGDLIDMLQQYEKYAGIVFNPGAYTHTSVALHDCLEVVTSLKCEVHLSEVDNREDFRKINFVRDVCDATFSGKKDGSYLEAIRFLKRKLNVL